MRNSFLMLIVLLAATVAQADESTVAFRYVDSGNVVAFTDDESQIPIAYKAVTEKILLGSLTNYARFTPVTEVTASRLAELRALNTTSAPSLPVCAGPVTVLRERRNHEGNNPYNSTFYVVRDSCGNEKSVTRTNPSLEITVND